MADENECLQETLGDTNHSESPHRCDPSTDLIVAHQSIEEVVVENMSVGIMAERK